MEVAATDPEAVAVSAVAPQEAAASVAAARAAAKEPPAASVVTAAWEAGRAVRGATAARHLHR